MSQTNLKYKDVYFDSDEEVFVAMWAEELKQAGVLSSWIKTASEIVLTDGLKIPYTKTTQLKTKVKIEPKEFTLLRPSVYTMDFILYPLNTKYSNKLFGVIPEPLYKASFNKDAPLFCDASQMVYIEVKPSFDQNNMERLFVNNQKFIWDKYKTFVNLIEPVELFRKTFLPLEAAPHFRYKKVPKKAQAKGKKVGDFKFDWIPKTINEFLNIK